MRVSHHPVIAAAMPRMTATAIPILAPPPPNLEEGDGEEDEAGGGGTDGGGGACGKVVGEEVQATTL